MVSDMIHNIGMVARGETTVTELAQKRLELLKKENPAVNAVVEYHPEKLLSEAAALDRRLAEGEHLKMAGSIITVKDNLNVEGMKSTAGMTSLKDNTAASD